MSLKDVKQGLFDEYIDRGMSEKDFDKVFKKAMDSEYVRKAISDAFNDEHNILLEKRMFR